MKAESNGLDTATQFTAAASDNTAHESRNALNYLVNEYAAQSATLTKVAMGKTSLGTAEQELEMADKLRAHLKDLALQIHIQSLICARIDGVNVDDMITEIKTLIDKQAPNAPGL